MNKLDSKHQQQSFEISTASHSDMKPVGRLIVLVPADSDYATATRRIWELAVATRRRVQLISLCKDMTKELSLRRQLITMSALVGDSRVATEAKVEIGANWVDVVKKNYQADDIIVCFAEQRFGLAQKPLNQILEASLDVPIYILSGLHAQSASRSNWLSQLIVWMGSFAILAGCFWLQIRISQLPKDSAQTLLLLLSVGVEFWLIWVWNILFR